MIVISSPLNQDKVIELLNSYEENDVAFTFVEKEGIKLFFQTDASDKEAAAKIAKTAIKNTSWGAVLYFQVSTDEE